MLWMGKPKVHAACGISATALPLYAFRKVPRRAIALLRMTSYIATSCVYDLVYDMVRR